LSSPIFLPKDRIERVSAWGMNTHTTSYVFRPTTLVGIQEALNTARQHGRFVALRGSGCSYGDASLGAENVVLDITRMNRILSWDPVEGVAECEPGVTIKQLWQYTLGDGWWPYVVSGTMFPTLAGAAAMNIHGKNNFRVGTIGDHILEFDLMLPSGELRTCNREQNATLFHAAIGGFGMLGVFTRIKIHLKKIYSGHLKVTPIGVKNWREMFTEFDKHLVDADYLVGWIDCFGVGEQGGRGQIHRADYLKPGEDMVPSQTLQVAHQELPDTLFGLLPKSIMWKFIQPFTNNIGMRAINFLKYLSSVTLTQGKVHNVTHAGFAFLLDYVPGWKYAYLPGGLIQYQSFIPKETAEKCFKDQIELCQKHGIVPYLGVFKRHRTDPFLMTHSVDGYSLALDFKVTRKNRAHVWALAAELDALVLEAGGRFYFAKDSTLQPARLQAYLSQERVQQFLELKAQLDPENLLQTDLYRRIFGG
jgi:decaprenylphospho-beta-D-ribofuranose 2-oxidase